jgi:hypothetical protein
LTGTAVIIKPERFLLRKAVLVTGLRAPVNKVAIIFIVVHLVKLPKLNYGYLGSEIKGGFVFLEIKYSAALVG